MNKAAGLLILLILFTNFCISQIQYPRLIIQFTDKKNTSHSFNNPQTYLSAKAIQRRLQYAIPLDSTDLPVDSNYINAVAVQGPVTVLSQSRWLNQILIHCTDQTTINKIQALPFVKQMQPVGYKFPSNQPADNFKETIIAANNSFKTAETAVSNHYDYGASIEQIHIHEGEFLHNKGYRGQDITIAMLDAGFSKYKQITAFDSIRLKGQVLGERDFVDFDNSVNEDNIHGMHCLSILAANWPGQMIGSAPEAKYWLLRSENTNSEYPIEEHNWVTAAEFADSSGADMISSSVGYSRFHDAFFNHTYNDFYQNTTPVSKGAAYAAKKGLIVMNSAGNEGSTTWQYIIFPADTDSVCTVGAVNEEGQIANFSSHGYPGKVKPNIVSVGHGTFVAGEFGPVRGNGTSFSNPNIAGLIACLWQAFPQFNNMQILNAVYKSADKYNNPDNRHGFGIPNMRKAYQDLKHQQNVVLYGNEWLWVTPGSFNDTIQTRLIGRVDGAATVRLIDLDKNVIITAALNTEKEELYHNTFQSLEYLPVGIYTLQYTDALTTRTVLLQKLTPSSVKDWLTVKPIPFEQSLYITLKAPESGSVVIRLLDNHGKILQSMQLDVTENNFYFPVFTSTSQLAKGTYWIQYIGNNFKKTVKALKL